MSEGWIARFLDGPCEGQERVWFVGEPWPQITLAPLPIERGREVVAGSAIGWGIVAGSGIAKVADADPTPWPGQVTYALADIDSQRIASYRVATGEPESA